VATLAQENEDARASKRPYLRKSSKGAKIPQELTEIMAADSVKEQLLAGNKSA